MAKTDTSSKSKKSSNSDGKTTDGVLAKFVKGLRDAVATQNVASPAGEETPKAEVKVGAKAAKAAKNSAPTPSVLLKAEASTTTADGATVITPTAPGVNPPPPGAPAEPSADDEIILTDAEGRRYCRATDCDQIGTVDGYCRFHYLLYWKKIQNRKRILADGKLERYIEELTARYSDKFVELLRKDTRTEKDFMAALAELELDDSASASAAEEDETKTYIEEISGVAAPESREDEGY